MGRAARNGNFVASWLVAGMLPGIERQPRKKLEPSPERLLALLHRWRDEAARAGRTITPRIRDAIGE
jgi:transposase